MSAWSDDLKSAPRDTPILLRSPVWDCIAVIHWETEEKWSGWVYTEQLLNEVDEIEENELVGAEWALIPG